MVNRDSRLTLSPVSFRDASTLRGPTSREIFSLVFFDGLLKIQVSMLPLLRQPRQGAWPSFRHLTLEALKPSVSSYITNVSPLLVTLPAATFIVSSRA